MALPSNHRWIAVGKLTLRTRANAGAFAPDFEIQDLIDVLSDRVSHKDIYRAYSKDNRLMWCENLDEDDQYHFLTVHAGDKNVYGVSFLNFETKNSRDIQKRREEGSHYTSHILIKKSPDQANRHLILVERVPGIYLSSVKAHFTWACKNLKYQKPGLTGGGRQKFFRLLFELDGHQSKTIRDALQTGILQDIELVAHEEDHEDGLDEDPVVRQVVHEARIDVKRKVSEGQALKLFQRVIVDRIPKLHGGSDNTKMFVRIKAANGQIKRAEIEHNGAEILEQAFIQNEVVNDFDQPLTPRYEGFRSDMLQKMRAVADHLGD